DYSIYSFPTRRSSDLGSIGEKPAFIGTFIWLSSWVIWLVSTSSKVWIPLSALISGHDSTQSWSLFGLSSTQTIGILGILWILFRSEEHTSELQSRFDI